MNYKEIIREGFFWALQALCALHRKPFSAEIAQQQLAAPYTAGSFLPAADADGFDASLRKCKADKLHQESFPLIAWLSAKPRPASWQSKTHRPPQQN